MVSEGKIRLIVTAIVRQFLYHLIPNAITFQTSKPKSLVWRHVCIMFTKLNKQTKKQKLLSCKMWQKMLNLVSIWARLESDVRILVPSLCVPLVTMVISFLCTGQGHFISLDKTYDFYVKWKKNLNTQIFQLCNNFYFNHDINVSIKINQLKNVQL